MGKLGWALLILYLTAVSAYGGWQAQDLWLGWGIWCLLIPPLALAAYMLAVEWRANPHWGIFKIHLAMAVIGVAGLGGAALVLAWVVAAATESWSEHPAVRAALGAALGATAAGMALLSARSRKTAEPPEARDDSSAAT